MLRTEVWLADAQRIDHAGSLEWTASNDRMMWSDETYRILGYEPQGCLATYQEYLSRVNPEDRKHVRWVLESATAVSKTLEIENID